MVNDSRPRNERLYGGSIRLFNIMSMGLFVMVVIYMSIGSHRRSLIKVLGEVGDVYGFRCLQVQGI